MTELKPEEYERVIASAKDKFMSEFSNGNLDEIGNLYTENGQLLPPNTGFVNGKTEIAKFWGVAKTKGVKDVNLKTLELNKKGDIAIEVGEYSLKADDGNEIDVGKFMVIWKQEGGGWKLHRDIWNSNEQPTDDE